VSRLVRDGVITLEPNGLIDPERADAQLAANRGGTMRTAPIPSRRADSVATSREDRIQYAIDIMLSTTALAKLHLDVEDPDKAEEVLRTVITDAPAILDGTFNAEER